MLVLRRGMVSAQRPAIEMRTVWQREWWRCVPKIVVSYHMDAVRYAALRYTWNILAHIHEVAG